MARGAFSQSITIVTAYESLGEAALAQTLQQSRSRAVFTDPRYLCKVNKALENNKTVQHLIYDDNVNVCENDIEQLRRQQPRLGISNVEDFRQSGFRNPCDKVMPNKDDLACVMFTSGTTGNPKGALIRHKNVVAAIAGSDPIIGAYLNAGDRFLAYLPLAHIFEFVFENVILYHGATLGYGSPATLSNVNLRDCVGDMQALKPTFMIAVPQVWENIRKSICASIASGGIIKSTLFRSAYAVKKGLLSVGLPGAPILDALIFNKINSAAIGGCLRLCLNGGGPIARQTQEFISIALAPMIIGYGLTETCAMGILMHPSAWNNDAYGELPIGIEAKLVDCGELGYYVKHEPPHGELILRGDAIITEYLDQTNENDGVLSIDRWFPTGDVAELDKSGRLKIIDRKTALVKALNGEYLSLERLEAIYKSHAAVLNACIYVDPGRARPLAIVVLSEQAMCKLAWEHDIAYDTIIGLLDNIKSLLTLLEQLQTVAKDSGLASFEIIDSIVPTLEEWTPQNGCTTAAQKIKRQNILSTYRHQVERLVG